MQSTPNPGPPAQSPPVDAIAPASQTDPFARRWWVMAAVGTGTYLNVLDNSMLNVSLPVITEGFGTTLASVQWVLTGYLLVISSLLLTGGRLADLFGRKRIYSLGMVLFIVTSALCGLAQNVEQLIFFRVMQGVGSAFVQGVGTAITTSAFPSTERGKALGVHSTTVALGGISGPFLGGIIADLFGWRWIFFLRIPLSLLVLGITLWVLHDDRPAGARPRFDIGGAVSLFVALASLLLALSQGRFWGWASPAVIGLFALAAITAVAFFRIETRVASPMVPLRIFRNRLFAAASLSSMLSFTATAASFFLMPFYLQTVLGYSAAQAGTLLVANMVMMSIFAPLSGMLSDRLGSRVLSPIGLGLIAFGLYQLSTLTEQSTPIDVIIRLALLGIGMGTFLSPNNNALMSSAPRDLVGLAAGVMAFNRNLGNVIGVAIIGTVMTVQTVLYTGILAAGGASGEALQRAAFLGAYQDACLLASGIAVVGVIASLTRGPHRPPVTAAPPRVS